MWGSGQRRASPHPRPPAGSGLESFCDRAELARSSAPGPPPSGFCPHPPPASPTQAAEGRAEREGRSPYLGRTARPTLPPPAPSGARAGGEGLGVGRGARRSPGLGWRGPGGGLGARGSGRRACLSPGPGLSWPRSVSPSSAGLSPHSAPFSGRGWAGAGITVTSPPFKRLSGGRSAPGMCNPFAL